MDLFKQMGEVFDPNPLPILDIDIQVVSFTDFDDCVITYFDGKESKTKFIKYPDIESYYDTTPNIIITGGSYLQGEAVIDNESKLSFAEYLEHLKTEPTYQIDLLYYNIENKKSYSKIIIK